MSALEPGWRRLGAVLVEAGLITEDDLIRALAAQEHSGRRLGEILVARGLVSAPAVANALAEQHGSFFKSEHGFGTGLRSSIERDSGPTEEASGPKAPPLSDRQAPTQLDDLPAHAAASAPPVSTDAPEGDAFTQVTASTDEQSESALESDTRDPESKHLLFVPTPHGYLLLEESGAPPNVGDVLDLLEGPANRAVVAKVASSPLPQDTRACAYLQPL
jgi:hypothetical protein